MASWLWKQLRTSVLIHKSVKFQIIDDPRVVVVAWLIKIGVVVYVSWALFFQFKYFKIEAPLGYTNIYATGFSKENAVPAGLCDGLPEYDFVYDELWSYTVSYSSALRAAYPKIAEVNAKNSGLWR